VSFDNNIIENDLDYVSQVNLRSIGKSIQVSGKIKNNYCQIVKDDKLTRKINQSPLLKSNLQKAVRLGKIEEALVSALNLIQIDFFNFIRRLIIISIEDVGVVLDNLPLLAFLLLSYQNIEITNEIIQQLLITVFRLCKYSTKHCPESTNIDLDYSKYDYNDPLTVSLIIASEYGGFKSDIKLYKRMINSVNRVILPVKSGNIILTRGIKKTDIIYSSIDHHCFPWIIDKICEECLLKGDTVKSLIWNNSSKINYRESHEIVDKEVWRNVTKIHRKIAEQILKKIYLIL
jgi:hypothetical protein